jgi:hypothetical protein
MTLKNSETWVCLSHIVRDIFLAVILPVVFSAVWIVVGCQKHPRQGYADSTVRYAERSYEGSAWVELKAAAAISSMITSKKRVRLGPLAIVTGVDRDNLWVVDKVGNLFRLKDGHWSYKGPAVRGMRMLTARATADGGIVVGGKWRKGEGLAIWRESGLQTFETARSGVLTSGHIHLLADDYINYFTVAGSANFGTYAYRLVSGQLEHIQPQKHRAFFVHTADNVPDEDLRIPYIRETATFASPAEAYGFWRYRDKGAVLRFQNGTWILIDELSRGVTNVRSIWFGKDDDGMFMIAAGLGGLVLSHPFGGKTIEQSVNTSLQVPTTADLIAVWGVDRNNFWVMDSSGTVWRWSDDTWRTVIRGLYDKDVIFRDAYVAPDGVVHAVTKNSIYRLE